jgi:hypothetical protein
MQNPKFFVLICALALGSVFSAPAQDTPAQAAARAAVAQKLFEISAEEGTNTPATTPPTAQTPVDQPVVVKPAEEPTMVPINNGSTPPTADEKAQAAKLVAAQARAQKEAEKQAAAQKKADEAAAKAKAKADQKAAALKAKQDAAAAKAAATQPATAPHVAVANAQQDAAMTAVAKAQADQSAQPVGTPMPASTMPFYTPPAPPISAEKVQQLNDLLVKYRADQITPAEYQAQRTAIMAQP